jgi:hypothetical protein
MAAVHCHICGATLRSPTLFYALERPGRDDAVYVCRDEARCARRAAFDPPLHARRPAKKERST